MKHILQYEQAVKNATHELVMNHVHASCAKTGWCVDVQKRLALFSTAGKAMRGSLLCYSYQVFSGKKPGKKLLNIAATLELVHSGLLIHDDIMDKDEMRRGQPSVHTQYAAVAKRRGDAEAAHYGQSMAICAGDSAFFWAVQSLVRQTDKPKVLALFCDELIAVCAGQMQDLHTQSVQKMISKKDIYTTMESKTAGYSLVLPLCMGALLADAPENRVATMRQFGMAAGTIFQIRDDELGLIGSQQKMGKPVGTDIVANKKTLPYYYLLQHSPAKQRRRLEKIAAQSRVTAQDIQFIQQLYNACDIPNVLAKDVTKLEVTALEALEKLNFSLKQTEQFEQLLAFCKLREK